MTSDYAMSVPGSIGREKSRPVNGIDQNVVYVLTAWAFLSLLFLLPMLLFVSGLAAMVLFVLFIGWWGFFFIYLKDAKHIEKMFLFGHYLIRTKRSENVIAKYTQPLSYIAKSYPVKSIHESGLVEYYGATNPWGVLLSVDPFKVSDDDIESYQAQLTDVFNSLPEGVKFTVINTSYVDESKQFISTVRNKANDPSLTRQQKEHLTQIHKELVNDDTVIVDWGITISIIFDGSTNLKEALVKRDEYVPGIVNGLQDVGLCCYVITDKTEIIYQYRNQMEAQIC
jgi:hypothetical protein